MSGDSEILPLVADSFEPGLRGEHGKAVSRALDWRHVPGGRDYSFGGYLRRCLCPGWSLAPDRSDRPTHQEMGSKCVVVLALDQGGSLRL